MIGLRPAALAVLAIMFSACAPPSRRLTPRIVEDPIVVPARMASAWVSGYVAHFEPTDERRTGVPAGFRYGITDRLEWVDLLSLRYALLDDRPADGRPARPLSLAVRAGVVGIGYSSANGFIVLPVASVDTLKHIGDRWALSLSAGWLAIWVQRRSLAIPSYTDVLSQTSHAAMALSVRASVTRQLSDRVALGVFVSGVEDVDCPGSCRFVARGASAGLLVGVRPWHWLTLTAGPSVGVRQRTETIVLVTPVGPAAYPPRQVEYVRLSGTAAFYW